MTIVLLGLKLSKWGIFAVVVDKVAHILTPVNEMKRCIFLMVTISLSSVASYKHGV